MLSLLLIHLIGYRFVESYNGGLAYLIPKDPIIYQDFDPVIQLCRGTHTQYCNAVESSGWSCTFQLLESGECAPNCKRQFTKSLIASKDLYVGLNEISCESRTEKVEQTKLFIRDRQTRLDCAAVPAVFHVHQSTEAMQFCVKHIPVRAAWLARFPQLKLIGFRDVICNSTVDYLKFDARGLLLQQAERIPSGVHLIECEDARFRIVFYQKSKNNLLIGRLVKKTICGSSTVF
ncbi:uncharacterized protein DEA37_0004175 [Paragonimus westermani]|uniref:Uncharacterized protein n=1 Tax=Paragonimus westermani TaxID=34504 RepID=A0A5J4NDI9_9TREM|nr:uncharacterized protein DEA37_0004175 [Paragonimus westermani]